MGKGGISVQAINLYDATTKKYLKTKILEDSAEVPTNATTVMLPTDQAITDIHNYVFNDDAWVGGQPIATATAEQQAITALAQQSADQQAHIDSLEQAITVLAQGGSK